MLLFVKFFFFALVFCNSGIVRLENKLYFMDNKLFKDFFFLVFLLLFSTS
jgi:hypothetical protein